METNFKKLSGASVIKKSKKDLLRNKTLSRNIRSSIDRRSTSREIPPLTPLHRLKRFKAIRDKNLNKNKKMSEEKKSEVQVEEKSTAGAHDVKDIKEESAVHAVKTNISEINEEVTKDDGDLLNGKEGIIGDDQDDLKGEIIQNGLNIDEHSKNGSCKLLESVRVDDNQCIRVEVDPSTNGPVSTSKDEEMPPEVKKFSELQDNNDVEKKIECIDNKVEGIDECKSIKDSSVNPAAEENFTLLDHAKKEGSVESDVDSDSSSSTFPADKFLTTSSEDILETVGINEENSDEEIDVDRVSTNSSESIKESTKNDEDVTEDNVYTKNIKPAEMPSKIPRSVFNSGSSYKTAYGSLSRISGRRAVGAAYRTTSRKRKAEEELESMANGKRLSSPSQPSPRWKFFRPSISNLWSPRKTPYDFSVTSTPYKNIDDSMAVNVDEETMDCHLNDSDLFLEDKSVSKRSKWGCNIM